MLLRPAIIFALFVATGLAGLSSPVHAAKDDLGLRLKNCKSINTLMTRISCYDEVAEEYDLETLEKLPVGQGSTGKWYIQSEISQIDDSNNIFSSLTANEFLINGAAATKYGRPSLVLRCKEGMMDGYVVWDFNLGDSQMPVTTRFDKNPAISDYWTASADRMALFIPDPHQFLNVIERSHTLLVETVPRTRGPVSVTFDLRGASEALKPLHHSCPPPKADPKAENQRTR